VLLAFAIIGRAQVEAEERRQGARPLSTPRGAA
jgi:hypothetical protein